MIILGLARRLLNLLLTSFLQNRRQNSRKQSFDILVYLENNCAARAARTLWNLPISNVQQFSRYENMSMKQPSLPCVSFIHNPSLISFA